MDANATGCPWIYTHAPYTCRFVHALCLSNQMFSARFMSQPPGGGGLFIPVYSSTCLLATNFDSSTCLFGFFLWNFPIFIFPIEPIVDVYSSRNVCATWQTILRGVYYHLAAVQCQNVSTSNWTWTWYAYITLHHMESLKLFQGDFKVKVMQLALRSL